MNTYPEEATAGLTMSLRQIGHFRSWASEVDCPGEDGGGQLA